MNTVVGVSEVRVSGDQAETLATYSLGSCIGVAAYDPVARVGGLLHFQLPAAAMDTARAKDSPAMFADSGMVELLSRMASLGAVEKRVRITLAGAAQILNDASMFNIGRRNHTAIRKVLWQRSLLVQHEEIGGASPRNLYLSVGDGSAVIKVVGLAAAA